ncbi:MAG TPA: NAD(P)/FAD-dependent oxidoreductase [Solirubrobacteraceae bacterium]|jgi:dihydrolipoamide dehydrogenase
MPFDVIVVGAGPAGEVAAGKLAERGLAVALVERELVGGECAYYACMPSKALLRPAQLLAEAARVPGAAQALSGPLDVGAVLERRDEAISHLDDDHQMSWLRKREITLLRGRARLDGELAVTVDGVRHSAARAVVLATGSTAALPDVPGLARAKPWTNREATTADAIPESLLVLGGGAVGVELAQAYASLGARVTLIEPLERLISGEEQFASEQVAQALREGGVDVRLATSAAAVSREGAAVHVELADGETIHAQELLVATGRRPRTDELGLERFGLSPGEVIEVDERLRVHGLPWLYAIGDVNGRSLLTHVGKHQARIAAAVIAGEDAALSGDDAAWPRVIFTDPQVAAVGLTLARAREQGIDAEAVDVETSDTAGASFVGRDTPGTSRLVLDRPRGVIVGATFTGTEVAEWLHAATIAIVGEVPLERLWQALPAFPTRSEVWLKLLESTQTL